MLGVDERDKGTRETEDGEGDPASYKEHRKEREAKGGGNTAQTWYRKG